MNRTQQEISHLIKQIWYLFTVIFWAVTTRVTSGGCRYVEGTYCLHHKGRKEQTWIVDYIWQVL